LASNKEIQVISYLPDDQNALINANKSYLRGLFFNQSNNAIKFSPQKGTIEIIADSMNGNIRVAISDKRLKIFNSILIFF